MKSMEVVPKKFGERQVRIRYTNWQGVTADRVIVPEKIWFGTTQWHTTDQWFLHALDVEKNETRDFALCDIQSWADAD